MKKIKFVSMLSFVLYSVNVFSVINLKAYVNSTVKFCSNESFKYNTCWQYSEFSKLNSSSFELYSVSKGRANYKNLTICINAGHGPPKGSSSFKVYCHPDKSPKLLTGSTLIGSQMARAISFGCTLNDKTPESVANLYLACIVRDKLLENGYNVLMISENNNCRLDNIARTIFANNLADCHIALHYDSTKQDKGAFYLSVPDNKNYKNMVPVRDNWKKHELLGWYIIDGLKKQKIKMYNGGKYDMDLIQTSYSTIPSIDLEVGDKATVRSEEFCNNVANGIVLGLNKLKNEKILFKQ